MLRKPHDQYWDALIGKMGGSCAYVEAPKGSVARVLSQGKLLYGSGETLYGGWSQRRSDSRTGPVEN